jgi:hypothetical protein
MLLARPLQLFACLLLATAFTRGAVASPVLYQFTTDPFGPPSIATGPSGAAIGAALQGLSVSGTFLYDSASPLSSVGNSAAVVGEHNYDDNPISNFSASVGALAITGANGKGDVADEGYVTHIPPDFTTPVYEDFLHFVSITDQGYSLLGLPLVTARLFWIEGPGPTGLTPDFLTSGDLPGALPAFSGRFALDFVNKDAGGNVIGLTTAFFNGLSVTQARSASVPEPGVLALLLGGALLLLATGLRRRAT